MAPTFIKRYLTALDRHKWAGLAGFTVVMGLSSVAALQPPPPTTFTSSGILTYGTPPLTFSETGQALQEQAQAVTREILLSDFVVNKTIELLKNSQIEIDAGTLRSGTTVEINPEEEDIPGLHVAISYIDSDSNRAQLAVTHLMEAMVEQSRFLNSQQLDVVINSLNDLLPKVTRELQEAEQRVERYIRTEGPQLYAARDGDVLGALTSSQGQQRQIIYTLEGLNTQIQSIQARLGLTPEEAYISSALSADPIIADLRANIYQIESQRLLLSQTLRAEHPSMVELQNQESGYQLLLQKRMTEVIGSGQIAGVDAGDVTQRSLTLDPARQQLANTLVNLQTQRDTLQQQLVSLRRSDQQLRQEYQRIPNKQLELARLQQQVQLKRTFYDQIESRLTDATIARNETQGNLVVAKPAETTVTEETTSNPVLILLVGGLVGVLVGGGLVLLLDSLDATFHTLPDLQAALRQQEVPVLGLLPVVIPQHEGELLPLVMNPESPYSEPYERLRSNLRRTGGSKSLKVILLTSTVSDEGKTLTTYNLAIASARAGKRTLLIEADLRSPSMSKALKVTSDPTAMLEPLRYYGRISECTRLVPEIENLYIVPSPGIQRQAAAILESSEVRQLLDDARGRFDLVLLDTPALSRCSDALLLEPYTDGLILITRPGCTEEGLLTEAIEQFNESEDIRFLGAVINGGDIPVQPSSSVERKDAQFMLDDLETQPDLDGIRIG